jgi:hypothetical protein
MNTGKHQLVYVYLCNPVFRVLQVSILLSQFVLGLKDIGDMLHPQIVNSFSGPAFSFVESLLAFQLQFF